MSSTALRSSNAPASSGLVNLIIGAHYGVFLVTAPNAWDSRKIDRLLKIVETSEVIFLRNYQELTGAVFAAHPRFKLDHSGGKNMSLDRFIEQIAGCSSSTGNPYQVRLASGELVNAGIWLREWVDELAGNPQANQATRLGTISSSELSSKPPSAMEEHGTPQN